MKYRVAEILASEAATTAATKTIDLNLRNPISRLLIRMKGTNSSSTPTAHPAKMLTKVEVVSGSDVLYSLNGFQGGCVNFHENGELPFYINEYEDNIQCCATVQLNFGTKLWDRDYALDPSRFKNLQLKITHNKALGGSAPDAGTLAVYAYVFDESPPSPRGFLMTKEQYSYSMTASAAKYIDLAQDYPYRFIIVENYTDNVAFNSQFSKLKITIDNDAKVLLNDISGSEFIKAQQPMDQVQENLATLGTGSAVSYYIASCYENYGVATGRSASQTTLIVGQPSGNKVAITNDSSESVAAYFTGYAPFGGLNILTVDKDDDTTWLNPAGTTALQVKITAGSGASGTAYVVTQQARTY